VIRYENFGGNSGVFAHKIDQESITIEFDDGSMYLYDVHSTSTENITEMQRLAIAGKGLNSYISRVGRKEYAEKIR
jgi:hypothetical protein